MLKLARLMDYSLLLIIANAPNEEKMTKDELEAFNYSTENLRYKYRVFTTSNGKYMYCVGIIDYLQQFNLSKFLENKYKTLMYGRQIKNVSAVDPVIYADRMVNYLTDKFL